MSSEQARVRLCQQHVPSANTFRKRSLTIRCAEVLRLYGPFGFLAFGGPAANIVMLHKVFVLQEQWVDEKTFTDLFALGNALPGPPFSQLAFAIALIRGGYLPAFLSFILLTGPGALIMFGLGFGVRRIPSSLPDVVFALFSGLNAAAVGLIALAAYNLSSKVITDRFTRIGVLLSAAFAICYESPWLYPILVISGGLTTLLWDRWLISSARIFNLRTMSPLNERGSRITPFVPGVIPDAVEMGTAIQRPATVVSFAGAKCQNNTSAIPDLEDPHPSVSLSQHAAAAPGGSSAMSLVPEGDDTYLILSIKRGLCLCAAFFTFLLTVLVVRATTLPKRAFLFFVNLLLAGTIIFGGGPVVIPLLHSYTVSPGWVNPRDFLLGFAIIHAVPGPLFNFSVFLGVLTLPHQPVLGGLLGCIAMFLPGIVLMMSLLPLYTQWRSNTMIKSVLRGFNAAAVGLIFAAAYRLLCMGYISPSPPGSSVPVLYASLDQDGWWIVITSATFVACEWFDVPSFIAIIGGAIGGIAWWGVHKS